MYKGSSLTEDELLEFQGNGDSLERFDNYEGYLDSQITATDMYYLEDESMARALVELGYRGGGEVLKKSEFEQRKKAEREKHQHQTNELKKLASANCDLTQYPFLQALANRYVVLSRPPSVFGLRGPLLPAVV